MSFHSDNFNLFECNLFNKIVKHFFLIIDPYKLFEKAVKVKVKSLSPARLSATPWTAAHQAPPSLGFSRREHWSGLPFPSPMHEKWKVKVKSLSHVWALCDPMDCSLPGSSTMGFSRQEYWSGVPLPSLPENLDGA